MLRWSVVALLVVLCATTAAALEGEIGRPLAILVASPILLGAGLAMESALDRRRTRRGGLS